MNPWPVILKTEDAPEPRDAQAVGIDLMAMLREIEDEAEFLQKLLTRWGDDPIGVMHRAQSRTIELRSLAGRAPALGEQLMRSLRACGALSGEV